MPVCPGILCSKAHCCLSPLYKSPKSKDKIL